MEKLINIRNAFTQSKNPNKFNLGRVLIALSKVESFLVLLINIEIDLKIKSVPLEDLIDFFNSYQKIDLDLPNQRIIKEYMKQLMLFFKDTLCQSAFSFVSDAECINVIRYLDFKKCHANTEITLDIGKGNYEKQIKLINDVGLSNMTTPFRCAMDDDDKRNPRIMWLAKYDELMEAIDIHPDVAAIAVNDILGLGFSNNDILLYVVFPADSKNINYKPTFKEGCIFDYPDKDIYFLNSKQIGKGWGKTRSTNAGHYGVCETISPALYEITDDFKLGAFGKYSANIDLSNILSQALVRLNQCD